MYTLPSPEKPLSDSALQYELPDDDAASGSVHPNRQSFGGEKEEP